LTARSTTLTPLIVVCLAATWFVWGSTYLAIKFALDGFPPFFMMGTRFLVAGLVLAAWMRWRGAPWPSRRQWAHALLIGALLLGGGMGATAYAELTVSSGLVVAFIAVSPLMIAALNSLYGSHPSRLEWAGIGVGLVGTVLLTQGSGFAGAPLGLAAIAFACATWCVGSVLSQRQFPLAPGAMGFASEMIAGALVLLLMSWLAGEQPNWQLATIPAQAWWAWVYLVVAGSLIAFNAYMVLLEKASSGLASSYTYVNPVIAMLLGVWLANEVVAPLEWAAVGIILSGVVLLLIARKA